jgi:hypothetical protein
MASGRTNSNCDVPAHAVYYGPTLRVCEGSF